LLEYRGCLLIVTHDAEFLDRVATRILELREGEVDSYAGNYSEYQRVKAERLMQQDRAAGRQERELARQQRFIDRFRAKQSKATVVKSREKMVAKIERIERPGKDKEVHIGLEAKGRTENDVLVMEHIGHSYPDGRGRDHVVLIDVNLHVERGQKVILVGPNGSGKSTLLKIAAGWWTGEGRCAGPNWRGVVTTISIRRGLTRNDPLQEAARRPRRNGTRCVPSSATSCSAATTSTSAWARCPGASGGWRWQK
jgi:ATP-binding cassette subfamily F protein 3